MDEYTNYLKPIISFRYSPNGNKNISDKDISLNYDSAFSLNRIGTSHQVEGGEAISLGLEFKKNYIDGSNILDFKIANVLRRKADASLPKKSKLNKTRSDIFGSLDYNIKENIKLFKIDAEGYEPEVLSGSKNTLKKTAFVSVDFGSERGANQNNTMVDVNNLLLQVGFELIELNDFRMIGLYKNKNYEN